MNKKGFTLNIYFIFIIAILVAIASTFFLNKISEFNIIAVGIAVFLSFVFSFLPMKHWLIWYIGIVGLISTYHFWLAPSMGFTEFPLWFSQFYGVFRSFAIIIKFFLHAGGVRR